MNIVMMSAGIQLWIYMAICLTVGHTASISNSPNLMINPQATVGAPPRPFGIPDSFTVETEDQDLHVSSIKTLLLNTIAAIEATCLVGYLNTVKRFRVRDASLLDGDVLDFQITEPQDRAAFQARYVLWGLYLCALEFQRLPDGDVPLGQGIYYCDFRMPGLGTGQFTYEEAPLFNGSSSQLAETSHITSKKRRQQQPAAVFGPGFNGTIQANISSSSITSDNAVADVVRIYNRGLMPLPRLTVFYAFYQVMIARASIPYPAPIPSYSYDVVGLGSYNINYRAPRTAGAPLPDLGTVLHGLAMVPRMMLSADRFTECDFDIIKTNELVVSGSFRRISGGTSMPPVQLAS